MDKDFWNRIAINKHDTPVLTELPPGYSNWQTEADLSSEIEQLRRYTRELEGWYVSDHQTTRGTAEQCLQALRDRHGVAGLFSEDTD